MTVSIDIDLSAIDAKMEIGQLKMMLESLDEDLDIDLGLDGDLGDTLDDLSDTMDELSESFNSDLNDTIDRLEGLEFDDINMRRGGGDSGGDTGSDSGDGDGDRRRRSRNLMELFDRDAMKILGRMGGLSDGNDDSVLPRMKKTAFMDMDVFESTSFRSLSGGIPTANAKSGGGRNRRGLFSMLVGSIDGGVEAMSGMRKSFKKAIPSMSTWMNLMGAAIPALGALAVQALGVASAFGAIAIAGAGMVGLGLLGHGDSMAESMKNAKEEIGELKKDLFETFEPAADLFGGVQKEFFDFAPQALERVSGSFEGLLVFKDEFFEMFTQLTKFASQFFNMLSRKHGVISELWDDFSGILGAGIIDFFEFLLDTASENEGMLKTLGAVLIKFGVALYNVFVIIGRTVAMLSPLFTALTYLSNLLNNSLISGMLAIVAVIYVASSALGFLTATMGMVASVLATGLIPLFSGMFTWLSKNIFLTLTQTMANYGLASSIATVTAALGTLLSMSLVGIGLAGLGLGLGKLTGMLDIGGPTGAGSRGGSGVGGAGGGGNVTNNFEGDTVNVDMGNADRSTVEKFSDMRSGSRNYGPTNGSYT